MNYVASHYLSCSILLSTISTVALISVCGRALADPPSTSPPAVPSKAETPGQIQEVVVTAQRRETTLTKTPVAVSSVSGAELKGRNLLDLSDVTSELPGVQFGASHTNADITIRGIGNSTSTQGTDPGVAFHLDGVYLGQTGLASSDFLDVARVEVLRGPQGTLYGRNATGGAVNVISNEPTPAFKAEIGGWVGADPTQVHVDGFVSGPVTADGTIMARFSARRDYNEGFTQNLTLGAPSGLDDQDSYALRAQILAKPNDQFSAELALDYASRQDHGAGIFLIGAPAVALGGQTMTLSPAQVAAEDAAQLGTTSASPGNLNARQTQANQALDDQQFIGVRTSLDWRLNAGTLKLTTAFDETRASENEDGDGTNLDYTNSIYGERAHQYYGELLFSSKPSGPISYIVGVNTFDQQSAETINVPISYLNTGVIIPSYLYTLSYAAFGHVDYSVNDRIKLFGGLRYTDDNKSIDEANNFIGSKAQSKSWSRLTYEGGASYAISSDVNAYAKYSTGYKSGGFQAGDLAAPFSPETDTSIEAGVKGFYFDRRLQANLTGFHMDYSNLQVNQIVGVASVVTNAAQAAINGAEAEIVALPMIGLRLEAVGSYLDATFTRFLSVDSARPSLGVLTLDGHNLPNAPRFSASLGAYYTLPVNMPGELVLGGRYYWKDRAYFSEFNLPVASQSAVGRADLSLDYTSADNLWQAGVFARNITDERVLQSVQVVSTLLNSAALGRLDPSREVGISLRRRF